MKKVIAVRKNKAQRAGLWFLLVIMVCAVVTICLLWFPYVQSFLLFFPAILAMFFIALYYETWRVSLGPNEITIRRLFLGAKTYSYGQITEIYTAYSYTLHGHICLSFSNGKRIRFRTEDENANVAKRRIQSHHSIRILNW